MSSPTHHPTITTTGHHGCQATCICGWSSRLMTTGGGAHLEFGKHLLDAAFGAPVPSVPDTQKD